VLKDALRLPQVLDLLYEIDTSSTLYRQLCVILGNRGITPCISLTLAPQAGLLVWPIIKKMQSIEGWLYEEEADLLVASTALALSDLPHINAMVEVGGYCGRATCVIASVLKTLGSPAKLHVHTKNIDTLQKLDVTGQVALLPSHSGEKPWDSPISLLLIHRFHDYENITRDFQCFEPFLAVGGYVAFHDYGGWPGVTTLVDQLRTTGQFEDVRFTECLFVLRKKFQI
jgi:hypothetical protein